MRHLPFVFLNRLRSRSCSRLNSIVKARSCLWANLPIACRSLPTSLPTAINGDLSLLVEYKTHAHTQMLIVEIWLLMSSSETNYRACLLFACNHRITHAGYCSLKARKKELVWLKLETTNLSLVFISLSCHSHQKNILSRLLFNPRTVTPSSLSLLHLLFWSSITSHLMPRFAAHCHRTMLSSCTFNIP